MNLSDLNERAGRYKARRRVGRGTGSGMGKTSSRGQKGQKSRSGYSRTFGFMGGAIPIFRKFPKRGFNNVFRTHYDIVNVGDLNRLEDGAAVNLDSLEKKLTVVAAKFTATARKRIEELGGEAREV